MTESESPVATVTVIPTETEEMSTPFKPTPIRQIIWSPTRGAYLGDGKWTSTEPGPHDTVPTFLPGEVSPDVTRPDGKEVQCFPKGPDNRATRQDAATAMLNPW